MIKLHARVTKEIKITEDQAERLVNYLCDSSEHNEIDDILEQFLDGVDAGNYEFGYIPYSWVADDLLSQLKGETLEYLEENVSEQDDIELFH